MSKLIAVIIATVFWICLIDANPVSAQAPTFGPTCAAPVGLGTPTLNPTFGPTCGVTVIPTATRIPTTPPQPTATRIPPTPTQPVSGNLGITFAFLGVAAFFVITGLTTLYSSAKSS